MIKRMERLDLVILPQGLFSSTGRIYLSKGIKMEETGEEIDDTEIVKLDIRKPKIHGRHKLEGEIIHIDNFGNLITNIDTESFQRFFKNRPVGKFGFKIGNFYIDKLSKSYSDAKYGSLLALFGGTNLLEFSINQGSASKILGLNRGDTVEIKLIK